jgi:hypothetical protein
MKINIVRLISFMRVFLTHLTMVWNHVISMFHTLYGLSIRVLPSYEPGLSVCIGSWTRTFKAIVYESHMHQPAQAI